MDRGYYKTTGSFMLMDLSQGVEFTDEDPREKDGAEPAIKNSFVSDHLFRGNLEELELVPEPVEAEEPAPKPTKAAKAAKGE